MRRRGYAFTLTELLVVIAIIAVLTALVFPVFARAREQARKAVCLSNAKQLGLASSLYLQDYDETFALAFYVVGDAVVSGSETYYVFDLLRPYLHNSRIFQCPTEPTAYNYPAVDQVYGLKPQGHFTFASYVPNAGLFTGGCATTIVIGRAARTLPQLQFPADQPAFYDGYLDAALDLPVWGRHQDGMNVALADGHARYMKLARNPSPTGVDPLTGKYADQWYIDHGPFRLPHDSTDSAQKNWMMFGLVTDPLCAEDVTVPCNINPPCR